MADDPIPTVHSTGPDGQPTDEGLWDWLFDDEELAAFAEDDTETLPDEEPS